MSIDCVVRAMLDRNSGAMVGQNWDPLIQPRVRERGKSGSFQEETSLS